MERNKRATGTLYEKKAGKYLENCGYEILEYNYRCPFGEIDIIARDGEYLVFCEVKYRSNLKKGSPLEAVTPKKQRTISKCALYYITGKGIYDIPCRFDVAAITGDGEQRNNNGKTEKIELIQNAFDYVD